MSSDKNEKLPGEQLQQLKAQLQQKLNEVLSNSSMCDILTSYGVAGAVEVEIKVDVTKLRAKAESTDESTDISQIQDLLADILINIESQQAQQVIQVPKLLIAASIHYCPCDPGDPPDDCCWK